MSKTENKNSRFSLITNFIYRNDKIILTAHETPDGDAIGSEIALFHVLVKLGKEVRIINADPSGLRYKFLDTDGNIELLDDINTLPEHLSNWGLVILDTNDTENIGLVSKEILPFVRDFFILDHHEGGGNIVTANHIESEASSTCELLYELFTEMKVDICFDSAQALFTGIVYDTGSFIYPKTTAKTFKIAEKLVQLGVQPNKVYSHVYESNSISSLMLQSKVLATLEFHFNQHVAVQQMTKSMIIACDANYDEADTLINTPLKSHDILVSIFLKENLEGILRCSLRSKGNIDVAVIAQEYGGGGHKTAAGFKSKLPLEEIKEKVLKKLEVYF
ncbi:MAG: bifunctional oligoribonuclease/PAP phosphatase NrnA [Spirochaetales bacterium]|nr:bifunctional oligoribonuclease/PAP phosphatase NrnA [Spirochaetales bacterium]